ncbi:MAG: hypothetical protein P1Q69_19390 [Candidatus Thorarchaeota archaeon]|nr:hypothetical protein [Candidatus Thorarchaeota archaeon]
MKVNTNNAHRDCCPIDNRMMAALPSILSGIRLRVVESGFRALSYQVANDLVLMRLATSAHEMILDMRWKGYRIHEVPVAVKYYDGRVSRVVKGLLDYSLVALCSIFLKLLNKAGLYNKNAPSKKPIQTIYVSDNVKKEVSLKSSII